MGDLVNQIAKHSFIIVKVLICAKLCGGSRDEPPRFDVRNSPIRVPYPKNLRVIGS